MKCHACGFDSPDGSQWCDFCKEPFVKGKRRSRPKEAEKPLPLDAAELERALASDWPPPAASSPRVRLLAYAFLGLWLAIAALTGSFLLWGKLSEDANAPPPGAAPLGRMQVIINTPKTE